VKESSKPSSRNGRLVSLASLIGVVAFLGLMAPDAHSQDRRHPIIITVTGGVADSSGTVTVRGVGPDGTQLFDVPVDIPNGTHDHTAAGIIISTLRSDENFNANYLAYRLGPGSRVLIKKRKATVPDIAGIDRDGNGNLPDTVQGQNYHCNPNGNFSATAFPMYLPPGQPTECIVTATDPGQDDYWDAVGIELVEEIEILEWEILAFDTIRFVAQPDVGLSETDVTGVLLLQDDEGIPACSGVFGIIVGEEATSIHVTTWGRIKTTYAP